MLNFFIYECFVHLAFLNKFLKRVCHVVIVKVGRHGHLHIKSRLGCFDTVMDSAPVGNYEAVVTPFIPYHVVKVMRVL